MRSAPPLRRAAIGVALAYATNGMSMALWSAQLPGVASAVGTGTDGLAGFLLANALGTLAFVTLSGRLVERRGARFGYAIATAVFALAYAVLSAATFTGALPVLLAGGVIHGAAFALTNVPQGLLGAEIERQVGRTVVPRFHACYSLGGAVGAAAGGALAAVGAPIGAQFAGLILIAVSLRVGARALIPIDAGRLALRAEDAATFADAPAVTAGIRLPRSAWTSPTVLLLGCLVFAATLSEGAANNWLAVTLVDGLGADAALGAAALATFLVAQTAGRLLAGPIVDRVGRRTAVLVSTVVAAGGVLWLALAPSAAAALVAAGLWGLGAALTVPLSMSTAATRPRAAASVAAVASVASLATVAGPPVIGLIAETLDVRLALAGVAAVLLVTAPLTVWAFGARQTRGAPPVTSADPTDIAPVGTGTAAPSRVATYVAEQPAALARATAPWASDVEDRLAAMTGGVTRLIFVGSGTSSFAARAVESHTAALLPHLEVRVLTPVEALHTVPASRFGADTMVVAVSQSATSSLVRDALRAARESGAATVFVTGAPDLAPEADVVLDIAAGPEPVGAKTKGYTTTVVTLLRLARIVAGRPSDLAALPAAAATAISTDAAALDMFADEVDLAEGLHVVGVGANVATAQEASLKIVETARIAAIPHDVEEFVHGHHRRLTTASSVAVVATDGPLLGRAVALVSWLRTIDVALLVVTDRPDAFPSDARVVALEPVPEALAPVPAIIPFQRLALALTARRGLSPDAVVYPEVDSLLSRKATP